MNQHLKFILAMFFCFIFGLGWSQNNIIKINGTLRDEDTGDKIAKANITGSKDKVALVLGDNIFYGIGMDTLLKENNNPEGGVVYAYHVSDPER